MSEKRLTLFPRNSDEEFPSENKLTQLLLENDFIRQDSSHEGGYLLGYRFILLLDQNEIKLEPSEKISVWFEYHTTIEIQVGADSQNIKSVKSPKTKQVIGDLEFAYMLIGKLHENIDAQYTDELSSNTYYIRDLDFSNYVGYGKSFIHLEGYFIPSEKFIYELEKITNCKIKFSRFWL